MMDKWEWFFHLSPREVGRPEIRDDRGMFLGSVRPV